MLKKIFADLISSLLDTFHDPSQRPDGFSAGQFVTEILKSLSLLFRDSKQSRRNFRRVQLKNLSRTYEKDLDPLLVQLCTRKEPFPCIGSPQLTYTKTRDFPILAERIAVLQEFVGAPKSSGIKAVWKDRRNKKDWYTFWAVVFYGTAGLILGTIQTVLQAVQTAQSLKPLR